MSINAYDDYELLPAGEITFVKKRLGYEIVGGWKNEHYIESKDFDAETQMKAHAVTLKLRFDLSGEENKGV